MFEEIRKQWLISFLVRFVVMYALYLFVIINFQLSEFLEIAMHTSLVSLSAFTTYHCAYRKNGTKWLLLLMVVLPIDRVWNVVQWVRDGAFSFWPMMVLFIAVEIYFWINCLKLYRVNTLYQVQNVR